MKDYTQAILRKFPNDTRLGFYLKPNFPAKTLGKVLVSFTKITSPGDVLAFYHYSGFISSISVLFTAYECHYAKGFFPLEDVKGAELQKETVFVFVNQSGVTTQHEIKVNDENVAKLLQRLFDEITSVPKGETIIEAIRDYSHFSPEAVNWLELRDEVMRTIDLLYEKFNDGKLTLLEYEEKKAELLNRL